MLFYFWDLGVVLALSMELATVSDNDSQASLIFAPQTLTTLFKASRTAGLLRKTATTVITNAPTTK